MVPNKLHLSNEGTHSHVVCSHAFLFAWIFLCVKTNQTTGRSYKLTNSSSDSDHSKQTIGVKTP